MELFSFFFSKHKLLLWRQHVSVTDCVPVSTSFLFIPRQSALNSSPSSYGKSWNVNNQNVLSVRSQLSPASPDPGSPTLGCLKHLAQPTDCIYNVNSPCQLLTPGSSFRKFNISGGCIFPPLSQELKFFLSENTLVCQRPTTKKISVVLQPKYSTELRSQIPEKEPV